MPLRLVLPGASSGRTGVLVTPPLPFDASGLIPVNVPCSFAASSSTACKVSRKAPFPELLASRVREFVRLQSRNRERHGVQ